MCLPVWHSCLCRLGRSPYAAKKRKEQQQAEEEEASRALMLGPRAARLGRGKRKRDGGEDDDGEEEGEEGEGDGWQEGDGSSERARQRDGRSSTPPVGATPHASAALAVHSAGDDGGASAEAAAAAGQAPDSPPAPAAAAATAQGGAKKHRQLRWIRRSETASPEPGAKPDGGNMDDDFQEFLLKEEDMEEYEEEELEERGRGAGRTRSLSELQAGADGAAQRQLLPPLPPAAQRRLVAVVGPQGRLLPLLLPLQRAAEAAEAAARQAAASGSAVGPRPLGPAHTAVRRKGQQEDDLAEPSGQQSPSGQPWLQVSLPGLPGGGGCCWGSGSFGGSAVGLPESPASLHASHTWFN